MSESAELMNQVEAARAEALSRIRKMAAVRQKAKRMEPEWVAAIQEANRLGVQNVEIARVTGLTDVRVSQIVNKR